jgi:thiamine-phosphate diphosphorylase
VRRGTAWGLPRLHLITEDAVLGEVGFEAMARAVLEAHGADVALHLRGHGTGGGRLFGLARALGPVARETGARLIVNDRVDVALAAGCGVQLGRRSIPVPTARQLLGPGAVLGYSAHEREEAMAAAESGVDFIVLGTIWPSASHPGEPGRGAELISGVVGAVAVPVVAIGGVTPSRAEEALGAGAHGVAVLSGVWASPDPLAAVAGYVGALKAVR